MDTSTLAIGLLIFGLLGLVVISWFIRQARKGVDEFGTSQVVREGMAWFGDFQNLLQQVDNVVAAAKRPSDLQGIATKVAQMADVVKSAIAEIGGSLARDRENSAAEQKLIDEFLMKAELLVAEEDADLRAALQETAEDHRQVKVELDVQIKRVGEWLDALRKLSNRINIQLGKINGKMESLTRLNDSVLRMRMQAARFGGLTNQNYMGQVAKIETAIHADSEKLSKMLDRMTNQVNSSMADGSVVSNSLLRQADQRIAARKIAQVVAA